MSHGDAPRFSRYGQVMQNVLSRPYLPSDLAACLAIFDSNVPRYLAAEERPDYLEYLDSVNAVDRPYQVLTRQNSVIACGSLIVDSETREARLAWGMVDRSLHRQKLGTALTQARLALARTTPGIARVGLETSQHTFEFYRKFGFEVAKVTPDGLAAGLDSYEMVLHLE